MRVLVCGGRDFADTKFVYRTLDRLHKEYGFDVLMEGDARGADRIAGYWARREKIDNLKFRVDPTIDGPWPAAGVRRNQRMLERGKPEMVIAFPGGRGTADMAERALKAGLQVIEITSPRQSIPDDE